MATIATAITTTRSTTTISSHIHRTTAMGVIRTIHKSLANSRNTTHLTHNAIHGNTTTRAMLLLHLTQDHNTTNLRLTQVEMSLPQLLIQSKPRSLSTTSSHSSTSTTSRTRTTSTMTPILTCPRMQGRRREGVLRHRPNTNSAIKNQP